MIAILDRRIKQHWTYFAELLERVDNFVETYDSDADSSLLAEALMLHFAQGSDQMLFFVCVKNNKVAGHLIATIDTWCGSKYATIIQYEVDKGSLLSEERREGWKLLTAWAQSHGANLQILARSPKMARVFSRYWGFTPERVLMRKRIL